MADSVSFPVFVSMAIYLDGTMVPQRLSELHSDSGFNGVRGLLGLGKGIFTGRIDIKESRSWFGGDFAAAVSSPGSPPS